MQAIAIRSQHDTSIKIGYWSLVTALLWDLTNPDDATDYITGFVAEIKYTAFFRPTEEQLDEMVAMRLQGKTLQEIGERYGLYKASAKYWINKRQKEIDRQLTEAYRMRERMEGRS